MMRTALATLLVLGPLACSPPLPADQDLFESAGTSGADQTGTGMLPPSESSSDEGSTGIPGDPGDSSGESGDYKFDLGASDLPPEATCGLPRHTACDGDHDPWHALGLGCPGESVVKASFSGQPAQLLVHQGSIGTHQPTTYPVREGGKMLVLSTGEASDVLVSGVLPATTFELMDVPLPAPLDPTPVAGECEDDPGLLGTGDCSKTMDAQWTMGEQKAYDYAEIRLELDVPAEASGFAFDLAFLSAEYPVYYQQKFNDMFVAWLEAPNWTGNVSFDESGQPISLNAAFLDFKDAANPFDCPDPCTAPELAGTAMDGHAGTRWLTTSAAVNGGDQIVLVLAIFDMGDGWLDSAVLLDNFRWTCEGGSPVTEPAG